MSENTSPTHKGLYVLKNHMINKGTAFSADERDKYELHGHLPPKIETIEEQAERCYYVLSQPGLTPIDKYKILQDIQDDNETLFFKVILDHLEEFAPIVYTPTIGKVCQDFHLNFKRPRGVWLNIQHKGRIYEVLKALNRDIKLIVVTDNQRILGLGDLGVGGIGIPIGKINLYTAGAGIRPIDCLPISIDIGCNRPKILNSPHYFGANHERVSGDEYDEFIEEFVQAVQKLWPNCLLQWEDFWKNNAINILKRYKDTTLSFNDDIQGTACVGVAGALAAYKLLEKDISTAKIVMLGGGAAGTGIMSLLKIALEQNGNENAMDNLMVLDSRGLISLTRPNGYGRDDFKAKFAKTGEQVEKLFGADLVDQNIDLETVIDIFKPDILIGTSGVPNTFSEQAIRNMKKHCDMPVIMPYSNPTSQCEAKPQDLIDWTDGKAIIATGSPFQPVTLPDGKGTQRIGQGNNVFVFPGIGLGSLFCQAKTLPDSVLYAAAKALSESVAESDFAEKSVYPRIRELRKVTLKVASEVVKQCVKDGLNQVPVNIYALSSELDKAMWKPVYEPLNL